MDNLATGTKMILRPCDNQYDPYAVGVFFRGDQIGWIPKSKNLDISDYLRSRPGAQACSAVVLNHDTRGDLSRRLYISVPNPDYRQLSAQPSVTQEPKMSKINTLIETNKTSATSAAYMEAGYIANKQVGKVLGKKLPMMVRGYADTPIGHLVVANLALLAVDHFRPDQRQLRRLAQAMQVQAYQELLKEIDIDGMIDDLLEHGGIKRALNKLSDDDQPED